MTEALGENQALERPRKALPPKAKPEVKDTRRSRAGQKVTVACKVPNGLIVRAFEWSEEYVPVYGGGTKLERIARPTGEQVLIHGPATAFGEMPTAPIMSGYALTYNVDAEIWDIWLEQNKHSDIVKKHQVMAHDSANYAQGWAAEHASVRSGLEGINPGTMRDSSGKEKPADPRMPRGTPNITGVTTDVPTA